MKLLITGATGGIGRRIVDLAKNNYKINFLTTKKNKLNSIKSAKGFFWDPNKNFIDKKCFEGVDTIIHLSGEKISKIWTENTKIKLYDSRILTTKFLYNSVRDLKPRHKIRSFISASAIGIYKSDSEINHIEKDKINPSNFLQNLVFDWERSSSSFKKLGIRVVNLRIGLVFYDGGFLKTIKPFGKVGILSSFGSGKQGQSWIHIDDLAQIFLFSIENKLEGIYNAVSPNPVNQNQMMRLISKILKRPYLFPNISEYILKLFLGEMSQIIISSHWVSCDKILKKGYVFIFPEIDHALKDILS